MIENGIVVKINKDTAVVKVDKKDECSKCGMCLFPKNASSIELKATNNIGAKINDEVIIKTSERAKLLGVMLVFLVPLVLVGIAVTFSVLFIKSELLAVLLSLGLMVIWYFVLSFIDKKLKLKKSFCIEITGIISKGDISE